MKTSNHFIWFVVGACVLSLMYSLAHKGVILTVNEHKYVIQLKQVN